MAFRDLFKTEEEKILFQEREKLSSFPWTFSSDAERKLKESANRIFFIKAPMELANEIERLSEAEPKFSIFRSGDTICYKDSDEQKLYEIVEKAKEILRERKQQHSELKPRPSELPKESLANTIQNSQQADYLTKMGLAETREPEPSELPPTDAENEWAEEMMKTELEEIEKSKQPEQAPKRKAGRKNTGRVHQIKTRLSESELVRFQRRVQASGLTQSEFLREASLKTKIVNKEIPPDMIELMDNIVKLRREIGRQGGLLKMVIKPNEGQRELAPNEWNELISTIRNMEHTTEELSKLEVKLSKWQS